MKKISIVVAILMLFVGATFGQTRQLTGTVTSAETGDVMPGVTVRLKGFSGGAISDSFGKFSISTNRDEGVIMFSFIGMKTLEVPLTSSSTYNVRMEPDVLGLDEVVVTALGISREKKTLGYAVQDIGSQELARAKDNNIVNTLSGKIAGVQVTSGGSTVGASSRIIIRGNASFAGNQPLFVIDGTPIFNNTTNLAGAGGIDWGNTAADIDPNNIESMTVLKGANAAALYGSRATNGVILITTKKGTEGRKLGVDVTSSVVFDNAAYFPKLQNEYGGGHNGSEYQWKQNNPSMSYQDYAKQFGYNYVDGNGGGVNDGWPINWGPRMDAGLMLDQWSTGPNSEWNSRPNNLKNYFQTGVNVENQVAITSNGEKASGRLAFTNLDTKGIIEFTDQSQNTINGSLTLTPTNRLTAVTNFTYLQKESKNMPNNGYSGIGVDMAWLQRDYDMSYAREIYDEQGNDGHIFPGWDNPFYTLQNTTGFVRDRLYGNISLDYKLTDWLSVMARAGTDFYNESRKSIELAGKRGNLRKGRGGQFSQWSYFYQETNADLMLNFDKTVGEIRLDGTIGTNYRNNKSNEMYMRANDLTVPDLFTISNAKGSPVVSMYDYEKETNSVYFAANGSFRDFLFLGVTGRNDWSSTLPEDNRSYFYPSVSAGLILTEALQIDSDVLSFAKLRGSWAQVGGDTGAYKLSRTYSASTYNNIAMFSPGSTLPPIGLEPEITTSFEFGADIRLWQDRLSLDVTFYDQTTVNQILSVATSTTTGYRSMLLNAGEIENLGVEIMAGIKIFDQNDGFKWNANVNWAKNKSTVNELYGDLESYQISPGFGGCKTLGIPGEEWGTLWGLPYVYDDAGNMVVSDAGTPLTTNVGTNLGTVTPDWTGGLRNSFSYGDLSLSFLLDARMGGQFFSVSAWHAPFTGSYETTTQNNEREEGKIADAVKEDGSINDTRVSAQQYYMGSWMWNNHEYSILDGSFLKLRDLSIGYDFDVSNVKWLQSLNLSFVGRNLAILWRHESTSELGIDPEVGMGGGDYGVGFENFQIPTIRSLGFKLQVGF